MVKKGQKEGGGDVRKGRGNGGAQGGEGWLLLIHSEFHLGAKTVTKSRARASSGSRMQSAPGTAPLLPLPPPQPRELTGAPVWPQALQK